MTIHRIALASALLLFGACDDSTSAPGTGDIGGRPLVRNAGLEHAVNLEVMPVSASWALQDWQAKDLPPVTQAGLEARPAPFTAKSRGYWFTAQPGDLVDGVPLPLTAPGSFIKISPHGATDLELAQLELVDGQTGQVWKDGTAVDTQLDAATMEQAGIPMLAGSLAFTTTLGAGAHTLRVPAAAVAGMHDGVAIQVEEPHTATRAQLAADNTGYLLGDTVQLSAGWDGAGAVRTTAASATVHMPDGTSASLPLSAGLTGALTLAEDHAVPGVPVEIVVDLQGVTADGIAVRRTVKTAVGFALPTAALRGDPAVSGDHVDVPLEVGSVGRYAITGVVYGTDAHGALVPFMMTQAAQFLDTGMHTLPLPLDARLVAASGLSAPFELRDVQLQDQSRMGVLERRALGGSLGVLSQR